MKKFLALFLCFLLIFGVVAEAASQKNTTSKKSTIKSKSNSDIKKIKSLVKKPVKPNRIKVTNNNTKAQSQTKQQVKVQSKSSPTSPKFRVIAGTVAIAEILERLNVELVGVPSTQYTLPKVLNKVTKIGNPMKPDMEVIKSLKPDVFVSVDSLEKSLRPAFVENHIPTKFIKLNTLDELKASILDLGKWLKREHEAKKIVDDINSRERIILNKVKNKRKPTVMIIFGAPGNFMIATEKSFVGSLAKKLGAENIINNSKEAYIPINLEELLTKQPDYILRFTHANPDVARRMFEKEFQENKIWQHFDAVKQNKVIDLDNIYFGMTANLKSIEALEKLAEILFR
ncbi:MAG: heme ABC transporter substrate-binding protein IsdE [Candidatus Omnitrophica bacterium]|nr:heme ABC transporter substrate-binding protein IsdE [Candidatus Omnitrophota bacterium]